jgi:hypothetical protein
VSQFIATPPRETKKGAAANREPVHFRAFD